MQSFLTQHNQGLFALSTINVKDEKVNNVDRTIAVSACELPTISANGRMDVCTPGKEKVVMRLEKSIDSNQQRVVDIEQRKSENGSFHNIRWKHLSPNAAEVGRLTLGTSNAERPLVMLPPSDALIEGEDENKASSMFQQVQKAHQFLPQLPNAGSGDTPDASKDGVSHMRVARPPAEGRGRNQLLPRYWPRITDEELQQISGEYPHNSFSG